MARTLNGTSDFIAANAVASWANNVAFSVSFWVKAAANATERCAYGEGRSSSANGFLEIYNQSTSTGKVGLRMSGATGTSLLSIASTATGFDNTPHHIAYAQTSAGAYVFYIDGANDHNGSIATTNPPTCNQLSIGSLNRNTNTLFYSTILFEVAKWSRQITAGEVASLANGLPASHFAPDHYWPLFGADSPEPDIGTAAHTGGTLTGTSAANSARISLGIV